MTDYTRDSIKLIVEADEDGMSITYSDMDASELWGLTVDFIGRLASHTGISYNEVCNDLKEIEEGE